MNFNNSLISLLISVCSFMPFIGIAQNNIMQGSTITVLNQKEAMIGASVILREIESGKVIRLLTGNNGVIRSTYKGRVAISINYIGFSAIVDTLNFPIDKTYYLHHEQLGLEEIVVAGQYQPTTIKNSLYNVKIINKDKILARGAVNLGDVMQNELNARVISDNILGSNIILQGITGQNVKILQDGVPLISGEANEFDLGQLNLNNVDRVEIVEGPLSVQYGTNALAGTVNIISKNMSESTRIQASSNAYYESVGQYNIDANAGTRIGKYQLSLAAGRNQFTGFASPSSRLNRLGDNRSFNWNPKQQYFGNAKISRKFGSFSTGVSHQQFYEDAHNKGAPDPGTQFLTASDNHFLTNRWNTLLFLNGKTGKGGYLDVLNSYQNYSQDSRRYIVNLNDESRNMLGQSETGFRSWNFRGTYSESDSTRSLSYQLGYEANLNSSSGGRISGNVDVNDFGLFSSFTFSLWNQLQIQPALRYAYNNKYDTRDINFLNSRLPFIPSLNIKFDLSDNFTFRASYAKGYRSPSIRELYYEFKDANHYIVGNTAIEPEIADNFIISARYQLLSGRGIFSFSPLAYINVIENKIELVELDRSSLPAEFQTINVSRTYTNIPDFRTRGLNLNFGYSYKGNFQLQTGGGLLQRSGSNSLNTYFTSYEANASVGYTVNSIYTRFNFFYKYNGPLAQFSLVNGVLADKTLQEYGLMDISATRSFQQNRYALTLGVKNLLNVTDVNQIGDGKDGLVLRSNFKTALPIAWGRAFFIRTTFSLSK